jgi:pectin methylesterase-like acyl-CoA thioesterase
MGSDGGSAGATGGTPLAGASADGGSSTAGAGAASGMGPTGGTSGGGAPAGGVGGVASGGIASGGVGGEAGRGGGAEGGAGGQPMVVDPSLPLTPVAFFPSKNRVDSCADASISVEFNRPPIIKSGGKIEIHDAAGTVVESITSDVTDLYFSDLVTRNGFQTDALDVVFNTVVFQPKAELTYGKSYYVTIDEGLITDSLGTRFSVQKSDGWTFTVRSQKRAGADTLSADGSGDFCSLQGILNALPDAAATTRVVQVAPGAYPGIIRMKDGNIHFKGAGADRSVFFHKNSAKMNGDREGIELSGSDVTFENLSIFNTYLQDSNGQQAEALYVTSAAKRVFLNDVHLRSHQDTLRVDGQVYMKGGKISGSTDPLWGTGAFYCDGCELTSRTSGHAFVVARSTLGYALVNCRMTRENASVDKTTLAQVHSGAEPGKIAFVGCAIDDHVVGWREPADHAWYEYGNTKLKGGGPAVYNGKQLAAGDPVLQAASSAQSWLGWAP